MTFKSVVLVAVVALGVAPPSRANLITDVTSNASVTLASGASLDVSFGTWTYALNNPGSSPAPLNLQVQAFGTAPDAPVSYVPGTGAGYYSGYSLSGYIESTDGSVIATLDDPNADRLGLPKGSILVAPGTYTGGGSSQQVATISASLSLTQSAASTLFGTAATQAWTPDAVLVLTNSGLPIVFGLGGNTTVRSAFTEPALSGAGPSQTAGVTLQVQLNQPSFGLRSALQVHNTPEPGSAVMMLVALASSGGAIAWYRFRKS